jgi:MFS family permease
MSAAEEETAGTAPSDATVAEASSIVAAQRRRALLTLGLLFGALYFIQGIGEPTEGLIAQPVRSLLKGRGSDTARVAMIMSLLALPWSLKPLFGLIIDFAPLPGGRRKPYLLLAAGATAAALAWVYFFPAAGGETSMIAALFVATMGIAGADVACDALMVEKGQPLGITGQLQSVQWTAAYGATVITGALGGYLSQSDRQTAAFLICSGAAALAFALTAAFVREAPGRAQKPQTADPSRLTFRETVRELARAVRNPALLGALAFLFLWSFNPFNTVVLNDYFTSGLGMSEQFYGTTLSVLAVASIAASVAYGFYCRRVPFRLLVHASIVLGVLATLAYLGLVGPISAWVVTILVGLTYMTATLVQLDLAARVCPPRVAGTVFATLMAATNLGMQLSQFLGGHLYTKWSQQWNVHVAFRLLVVCGAASTALCWLVTPLLKESSSPAAREEERGPT